MSRLECISDAVFGLAITLIVVSLKAPESFQELIETLQGFIGSGASALILLQIWNRHYLYFRRYGLEDGTTRALNGILLFIVVAYVYPLKFLFVAFLSSVFHLNVQKIAIDWDQLPQLLIIYGAGFLSVYAVFGLMYGHAYRKRDELELNEVEVLQTRWIMGEHWLMALSGVLSVLTAMFLPFETGKYAGFAYFVIPIFLTIHGMKQGDALRSLKAKTLAREASHSDGTTE